jgi:hypothetical protein
VLIAATKKLTSAFILAGAMATSVLLYFINPSEAGTWFPKCPFRYFTRLDCPGCGSLRGLHSLLHGNVLQTADYNLMLLPALLLLGSGFYTNITGRGKQVWAFFNKPGIVLTVICAFWVARNIPVYPLSWLASGE